MRWHTALSIVALVGLVGCPRAKKDDDRPKPAAASASAPAAVTSASAPAEPPKLTIVPRVKPELDGHPDGISGLPLTVPGAQASLQTPLGWQVTKGDVTLVTSSEHKAALAVTSFGAEGPSGKLAAATAALGLAGCQWSAPETISVGKNKLPSAAADGICTHASTQVRTAYVAPQAEKLLVVGDWEEGGDGGSVFASMRSILKGTTGDTSGIAACCTALRQNANVAPPEQKGVLLLAAGACDAARANPDTRAALAQVRSALAGAQIPASCK